MSTPQARPTRTVAATVTSKAETAEGFKLELQIPEFGGQFPTIVTRVPKELAAQIQPGVAYNLVLEQQNVSKRRDGTPYDGSKPWMYYWGLKGIASIRDLMPVLLPDEPETKDATRVSIERQKALDIAERFYSRYATEDGLSVAAHSTRLLLLATKLAGWLTTGKVSAQGQNEAVAPPGPSAEGSEEPGEEDAPY